MHQGVGLQDSGQTCYGVLCVCLESSLQETQEAHWNGSASWGPYCTASLRKKGLCHWHDFAAEVGHARAEKTEGTHCDDVQNHSQPSNDSCRPTHLLYCEHQRARHEAANNICKVELLQIQLLSFCDSSLELHQLRSGFSNHAWHIQEEAI